MEGARAAARAVVAMEGRRGWGRRRPRRRRRDAATLVTTDRSLMHIFKGSWPAVVAFAITAYSPWPSLPPGPPHVFMQQVGLGGGGEGGGGDGGGDGGGAGGGGARCTDSGSRHNQNRDAPAPVEPMPPSSQTPSARRRSSGSTRWAERLHPCPAAQHQRCLLAPAGSAEPVGTVSGRWSIPRRQHLGCEARRIEEGGAQ